MTDMLLEDCLRQKDSASKSSQKQRNNLPRQASQGPNRAGRMSLCKFICLVYMSYNILASIQDVGGHISVATLHVAQIIKYYELRLSLNWPLGKYCPAIIFSCLEQL